MVTEQTTVTLQGSEWLSFNVYENDHRSHSPTSRVALDFKVIYSYDLIN